MTEIESVAGRQRSYGQIVLILLGLHGIFGALTNPGDGAPSNPTGLVGYLLGEIFAGYVIYALIPMGLVCLPVYLFTRYRSQQSQLHIAAWLFGATAVIHFLEVLLSRFHAA